MDGIQRRKTQRQKGTSSQEAKALENPSKISGKVTSPLDSNAWRFLSPVVFILPCFFPDFPLNSFHES